MLASAPPLYHHPLSACLPSPLAGTASFLHPSRVRACALRAAWPPLFFPPRPPGHPGSERGLHPLWHLWHGQFCLILCIHYLYSTHHPSPPLTFAVSVPTLPRSLGQVATEGGRGRRRRRHPPAPRGTTIAPGNDQCTGFTSGFIDPGAGGRAAFTFRGVPLAFLESHCNAFIPTFFIPPPPSLQGPSNPLSDDQRIVSPLHASRPTGRPGPRARGTPRRQDPPPGLTINEVGDLLQMRAIARVVRP